MLDVSRKWMFPIFLISFRGRPAKLMENVSRRFHFLVVLPLVSSLNTSRGSVVVGLPSPFVFIGCGVKNWALSC